MPAVRATESQLAVGLSLDLVAFFVDGAMMTTTEQGEIRERRGASVSPVADVMTLAEPQPTAGKAAPAIAMMQGAPQRRRNRSRPRTDFDDPAIGIVSHHD